MNTVLVLLANTLAVTAFASLSLPIMEVAAFLVAAAIIGFALYDYRRPQRPLPGLNSTARRKSRPLARALTAA